MGLERARSVGVLAIGSEILDGRVREGNAHYIARQLERIGYGLSGAVICDDVIEEIVEGLDHLLRRAQTVIITGGLGPTTDDLTREAVAQYTGKALVNDPQALDDLKILFERRRRVFDPTNIKQATVPEGAAVIRNPIGTAVGFSLSVEKNGLPCTVIALPGVPREMVQMFEQSLYPALQAASGFDTPARAAIRIFGLPEAVVGGRVEQCSIDPSIVISYRASFPEIQVVFKHPSDQALVQRELARAEAAIGSDYVFSRVIEGSFEGALHQLLLAQSCTIGGAESCTGGLISTLLTNTPGASQYFRGAIVAYAESEKTALLGIPQTLLESAGAVSAPVAEMMASESRRRLNVDIAYSITGFAGPDGGTDADPCGTFFVGVATSAGVQVAKLFYLAERQMFRTYAAHVALDIVRRTLLGLPIPAYGQSSK